MSHFKDADATTSKAMQTSLSTVKQLLTAAADVLVQLIIAANDSNGNREATRLNMIINPLELL